MIKNGIDNAEAKARVKEFRECCSDASKVVRIAEQSDVRRLQVDSAEQVAEYERLESGDMSGLLSLESTIEVPKQLVNRVEAGVVNR